MYSYRNIYFTHSGEDEPTISIGVDLDSEVLPWGFTAVSNLNLNPNGKQIKEFQEIDRVVLELLPDDLKETYRSLTVDTYFVGSGS